MDRKKLNKFEHIRKANILFENRYEQYNKTIITEQLNTLTTCFGCSTQGDGYVYGIQVSGTTMMGSLSYSQCGFWYGPSQSWLGSGGLPSNPSSAFSNVNINDPYISINTDPNWPGGNMSYGIPPGNSVSFFTDQSYVNWLCSSGSTSGSTSYPGNLTGSTTGTTTGATGTTQMGTQVAMGICDCPQGGCSPQYTLPNSSQMSSAYLTVDNQIPQVGDTIYSPCVPQSAGQCTWEITAVGGGGTSQGNRQSSTDCSTGTTATYNCTTNFPGGSQGCIDPGDGSGQYSSLSNCMSACPTTTGTTAPTCYSCEENTVPGGTQASSGPALFQGTYFDSPGYPSNPTGYASTTPGWVGFCYQSVLVGGNNLPGNIDPSAPIAAGCPNPPCTPFDQCGNPTTGSTGCANITYDATCPDNPGGANNTQHNDGCSTIDGNMPDQSHVGTYATRPGSPNIWKILAIGAQNTTNNGHAYTSSGCTGGPTPGPGTGSTNLNSSCNISWNTPCAGTHLTTGVENTWTNFLNQRQTGWDSVGCQHLQNVVNWTTDQLNSGVTGNGTPLNPTQIARKTEKREWAQCQGTECGCTINMPPLTGGPTPPPPSAPPKPKPGEDTGGTDDTQVDVAVELQEEFTRMKTMWKYRI